MDDRWSMILCRCIRGLQSFNEAKVRAVTVWLSHTVCLLANDHSELENFAWCWRSFLTGHQPDDLLVSICVPPSHQWVLFSTEPYLLVPGNWVLSVIFRNYLLVMNFIGGRNSTVCRWHILFLPSIDCDRAWLPFEIDSDKPRHTRIPVLCIYGDDIFLQAHSVLIQIPMQHVSDQSWL